MVKLTESYIRAIKQWVNIDSADRDLYKALIKNKDFGGAKQLLLDCGKQLKPNIQNVTLQAYANLAEQYTNLMLNPDKRTIQIVKKDYNVELKPKQYAKNLESMGNNNGSQVFTKPYITSSDIIQLSGNLEINKFNHYQTTTKKKSEVEFIYSLNSLTQNKSQILQDLSISQMRVYIKCKSTLNQEFVVSTKWTEIGNFAKLTSLLRNINKYINSTAYYYDFHGDNAWVKDIQEYIVEYR